MYLPDLIAILPDGAIRGKLAAARAVEDGHACPVLRVTPGGANLFLGSDVAGIIGKNQERVGIAQVVYERAEDIAIAM